ncbi:cyclin-dependent kinase G-2-like [Sesamum indicum]|uniref:Cyclin-dependent kinase G-2-like n=1 Tax=Sesamum indicum TaxID=4182 RepID=A0A6I9SVU8_SESIN|nr:cyclin-dependent kinase G-2-like [Sesamum indicum]
MAEAGLLNFLGHKNDHHPFLFSPNDSQSHPNHFLRMNLIFGKANNYEYMNVISQGSYGVVYRACDKRTGEIVAMKEECCGLSTTTLREIGILKALPQHPAVVEFKEVVLDDWDSVFVVMEHVESDLKRFMDVRRQPLRPNEVKCMMKQLLEGVKFLHDNGVMHRDLKPSNILINKKGEVKICDFGLSRQFERESGSYTPRVVTLWYRAPEILAGAETYSTAIDMWSVGCIMAELLLKEVLFKGKCDREQRTKIYTLLGRGKADDNVFTGKFLAAAANSGAPLLSELGFDLLKKLLEYDPDKRITAQAALNHGWFKEFDPLLSWFSTRHQCHF